ncbi:CTL-2 [Alphabaculovirus altermyunipunctae]|jgi:hypothetical protein|uniref:CTL-2 n=1 Tax=Mythimna unipuncta nucleopolyhedrovirus TaxID=447897 RepID=A0A346TPR5_9ABAC|nr:CTL-2 [Mythimna unipuncta nucleopolyhedrovirus]AXU41575.1 CTL-2 [Mythimna unipuncta nucleopolyhedrovirus]
MHLKTIVTMAVMAMAMTVNTVYACTENGLNCQYSNECCSGACSAVFKFCLPR